MAGASPDPYSTGIAVAGGLANYFTGKSAANAQKEALRRQGQLVARQGQLFAQAQPFYQPAVQQAAQYAGLGGIPGAPNADRQQFGLGGNFGSEEDQLRLRQAEEDINHRQMQQQQQLRHQLGGAGVADASIGAALARNQQLGQQQYGGFRRGLAINAGQEQERRRNSLMQLLGIGFGQGSQASAGYGQQAASYGGQADQAYGGLGNILSQYGYQQGLGGQAYNANPYPYSGLDTQINYGDPGYNPNVYAGPPVPRPRLPGPYADHYGLP